MVVANSTKMASHHKLIEDEEFNSKYAEMIIGSVVETQEKSRLIKKFVGERKKEIVKLIRRRKHEDHNITLDSMQSYFEHIISELMQIERMFEGLFLQTQIDSVETTTKRMQPFIPPLKEVKKAYDMIACCEQFDQAQYEKFCHCLWENVPKWRLEDTRNILVKPKTTAQTEFDQSDLKFKQEMIYLRTKMFSLPKKRMESKDDEVVVGRFNNSKHHESVRVSLKANEFIEILKEKEISSLPSVETELAKISSLKFSDGIFTTCEIWLRVLDTQENQLGSKWQFLLCPQIEKILKKRLVPVVYFRPYATFKFLLRMEENPVSFLLSKNDLIPLLKNRSQAVWFRSLRRQFQTVDGNHIAATVIQAAWRGYWLRKMMERSNRLYIAASVIWFNWIVLKKKRELHQRYLANMLMSLHTTRELTLKLSKEFNSIIQEPHVVLHLTSIGQPLEMRRALDSKMFSVLQNMTILRICFVRNPKSEVIYISPVKCTEDLLTMYSDFIESISSDEDVAKRITFIALSQEKTFEYRSLNVSRILHCSEDTLDEIRRKIAGKSAYFLPWIVDECDMRLAGNLGVPLLSPDMELQREYLNASRMSEIIEDLGLLQPPHARDIKDYDTLCRTLSQLIVLHTEIYSWSIQLNYGIGSRHRGIFLINHISIPFMTALRRERKSYGDKWKDCPNLRAEYLAKLIEHLPTVVSNVTRLAVAYKCWKEFYSHLQKFGCLVQAVPGEKTSKTVDVSLFIPGKATAEKPRWMGTADEIYLESVLSTTIYMLPQSSLEIAKIEHVVNKFALGMQDKGYFGYLTVICYCFADTYEEKLVVWLLKVKPFYSHMQSYVDWMKFAMRGVYNQKKNQFVTDVPIVLDKKQKKTFLIPQKTPHWNETNERYAVAISQLYHSRFSAYSWVQLREFFEKCGIAYDAAKMQGSNIIIHDSEVRSTGLLVSISPSMTTTLSAVDCSLRKLQETLALKSKHKPVTNLLDVANFFSKLSLEYQNQAAEECT